MDHRTRQSDAELDRLVEMYSRGDKSAIGKLVEHESERLARWLRKRMSPRLLRRFGLSDIVQQTAIELVTLRPRFENRGSAPFRRLLRTIASRVLARVIRGEEAKKRDSRQEGAIMTAGRRIAATLEGGDFETPSALAMRHERIAGVKQCFARLPVPDRQIIRLIDYERLDFGEAAGTLGISDQAARKRHSRAVARLRLLLEEAGVVGD